MCLSCSVSEAQTSKKIVMRVFLPCTQPLEEPRIESWLDGTGFRAAMAARSAASWASSWLGAYPSGQTIEIPVTRDGIIARRKEEVNFILSKGYLWQKVGC